MINKKNNDIKKISVIMSVYNEEENILRSSIDSILHQSFPYFEFIIVNDNPSNMRIKKILHEYKLIDNRIIIINNSVNLGLPASLNKAVATSKTEILARMDGDDISMSNRFQKEYDTLVSDDIDVVFSNRVNIDVAGNVLSKTNFMYNPDEIKKLLPAGNIITHPSIMMKKSKFDQVNGYREFPSAQDYDLWLRLISIESNFKLIIEPLIYYRISDKSNSRNKQVQQTYTISYIKKLYKERKSKKQDSFSELSFKNYLANKKIYDLKTKKSISRYKKIQLKARGLKKDGKFIKSSLLYLLILISNDFFRQNFINKIHFVIKSKSVERT